MSGWNTPPIRFARIVSDDVGAELKRTAGDMLQAVILGSPVDLGTFRGNHRVSEGGPDYQHGTNTDKDGPETLRIGLTTITGSKPFTTIYIQNNLPYAVALENGHSERKPFGIYSVAFETVLQNRR